MDLWDKCMDIPITGLLKKALEFETVKQLTALALVVILLIIVFVMPKLNITTFDPWQTLILIGIILIALIILVIKVPIEITEIVHSPKETKQTVNVESIENPERGKKGILIDLSHYQDHWVRSDWSQFGSIFHLAKPKWITLIPNIETEARLWDIQEITNEYLFNWHEIPGNDNKSLIKFLKQYPGIDLIEPVEPEKSNDGKVIKVSSEKNLFSLRLYNETGANKVLLTIDDRSIEELLAKNDDKKNILKVFRNRHQLCSKELKTWNGLIFGIPEGGRIITNEVCNAIVKWVRDGGRLIMLGFELGDRHHKTNLNMLAEEFGLRFNSDIVAPEGYKLKSKSYGKEIYFNDIDSTTHPILDGVEKLSMRNLCTLSMEPGAKIILTVGNNRIGRWLNPRYRGGYTEIDPSGVKAKYEFTQATSVPIVAEAPQGLTGEGSVLAIGTWDFFGSHDCFKKQDNYRFVRNLLIWLTR